MAARDDIREGDEPQKPRNDPKPDKPKLETNAQGYEQIRYGQNNDKIGYAKVGQARNQPGFVPRGQRDGVPNDSGGMGEGTEGANLPSALSYLNDKQAARVNNLLGDKYDPTKPLNIQLFQARWAQASPEERRNIAANVSGQFLEGGPTSKSLSGFHSEYLDVLREENSIRQQSLSYLEGEYGSMSGRGINQAQADAEIAHWTNFAATPEGQAHIAQTGLDPTEWLNRVTQGSQDAADAYSAEAKKYAQIARTQVALGITPTGMKPPGWASTLASIKAGTAHLPSAEFMANYPGVVADLAGIADQTTTQILANRRAAGLGRQDNAGGQASGAGTPVPSGDPATMPYQPLFADAFGADDVAETI